MTSPRITYAAVAGTQSMRDGETHGSGPLGYSVNRQNTAGSTSSTERRPSNHSLGLQRPTSPLRQIFSPSFTSFPDQFSPRPSIVRDLSRASVSSSVTSDILSPGYRSDASLQPRKQRKRAHHHRNVQTATVKESSPLLMAILDKNLPQVESLIEQGANIRGENNHYDKPLQTAALVGSEDIVNYLLNFGGLDINSRDPRSRTAMFAAKSRGNDNIVKLLRDKGAKPLSSEEERIAKRELKEWSRCESLIGPHDQTEIENIQPFQPEAPITNEPEEEIVEEGDISPGSKPHQGEDNLADGKLTSVLEAGSLERIKEKQSEANKKRQDRQRNGEWIKGPPKSQEQQPPQEEILPQKPRYPGFGFNVPTVEFDFTDEGGHRIISPVPTVDDLIYGRGPDNIAKEKDSPFQGTCRWYHLPANHLGWVKDLITKIYEKRSKEEKRKKDILFCQEPFSTGGMEHANPMSLDPSPQARALRPKFRSVTLDRLGAKRLSTAMELRIPFVHWETEKHRAEMHDFMNSVRRRRKHDIEYSEHAHPSIPDMNTIDQDLKLSKNKKLLLAYLYNNPPLHPRRTLDQFYYHMLENTQSRDKDQVIDRYYQNSRNRNALGDVGREECQYWTSTDTLNGPTLNISTDQQTALDPQTGQHDSNVPRKVDELPLNPTTEGVTLPEQSEEAAHVGEIEDDDAYVMMIDQLWIWILDENTIITSFPQNWNHDDTNPQREADEMDVLQNIYSYLSLQSRTPLESVYDLAQLIVAKCLATFCTQPTPYGPMRILDVYESAIAAVTDNETKLFNDFADRSKKSNNQEGPDTQRLHAEDLYSIDAEIEQLREIKDIQDELHIISVLLDNQKSVFEKAKSTLKTKDSQESWSRPSTARRRETSDPPLAGDSSSPNQFERLSILVDEQDKRRKAIEWQAEQANRALNHLLDLKQKQANVSEARSARLTSESTKQQGNIMVLFTLVTIIFAPLSLMATMFGVDIVEYPDNLHMEYVLRYMFAVSVAVTVPLIGLVVYTTRLTIQKIWIKIKRWWRNSWGFFSPILRPPQVNKLTDKRERGVVDEEKAQG